MSLDDASVDRRSLLFIGGVADLEPAPGVRISGRVLAVDQMRRAFGVLGLHEERGRQRFQRAVTEAIEEHRPSVLVVGSLNQERSVITVRPAREAGWAAVSQEPLNGGAAQLDWQRLQEVFQLSRSEAEVALSLLSGKSLVEIARGRGVQHETVRGQVKTLLRKVGVANQKQLTATLTQVGALLGGARPRFS